MLIDRINRYISTLPTTNIKKILLRVWDSPTITTWGSYSTSTLNFIFVLPLLLTRLSTAEIALWYLFKSIMDLLPSADLGFGATFTRVIAYAMGGINDLININCKFIKYYY